MLYHGLIFTVLFFMLKNKLIEIKNVYLFYKKVLSYNLNDNCDQNKMNNIM